jgi:membrane-associated phospholipid phosphatase
MHLNTYLKKFPLRLALLVLLFIISLSLFGFITHEVLWEKEAEFDEMAFNYLKTHTNDKVISFMSAVTFFGSSKFLFTAYVVLVIWYLIRKKRAKALDIATIGLAGYFILYLLKLVFRRTRPLNPLIDPLHNFGFPSGHASSSFIFFGLLIYLLWKESFSKTIKWCAAFILLLFALLVGISRIYLRLHYASDVLAGFCLGFAWLSISILVLEHFRKKNNTAVNDKNHDKNTGYDEVNN